MFEANRSGSVASVPEDGAQHPHAILVTGATGLAGWAFLQEGFQSNSERIRVEGLISRTSRLPVHWPNSLPLHRYDLSNLEDARQIVRMKPWKAIVHADRICRLKYCERDPVTARRINVEGTRNLAAAIAELPDPTRPRLIFCSTDHVFNGKPECSPFRPDSSRSPITTYGKLMVEAEDLVTETLENSLILRNGLLLGRGPLGSTGPVDWLRSRLSLGKPITYFHNEIRTPLGVRCLGRIGIQLALSSRRGRVHLSMRTRINRYDLALRILKAFGLQDAIPQIRMADRRHDSIQRVAELALEDGDLELEPKELAESLEEEALHSQNV